jgi:hypothetical protein
MLVVVAGIGTLMAGCSGDNSAPVVQRASPGVGATTTLAGSTATTASGSTSSTAAGSRAIEGLLTVEDLPPGWKAGAPSAGDDSSDTEFDTPECAALKALDDQPGLEDDASVDLTAPDEATSVTESLVVAAEADAKRAYATAAVGAPGQLPHGTTLERVDIHPAARHAGDEAAGFEGLLAVKDTASGTSVEVPVRFDVVRAGGAVGLLLFVAEPNAAAVDADGVLTSAATKMATVG